MRLVQGDMFAPPVPVAVLPKRRASANARAAHERLPRGTSSEIDRRVLADVLGASKAGRTRNELSDRLDISVQTLCWSLQRLLRAKKIFRRVRTPAGHFQVCWDQVPVLGVRPQFESRARNYIVYAALYAPAFEAPSGAGAA